VWAQEVLVLYEKPGPQYQLSTNTDISVPWVHSPTTSATLRLHPIRLSHLTRWKDPLHSHHFPNNNSHSPIHQSVHTILTATFAAL